MDYTLMESASETEDPVVRCRAQALVDRPQILERWLLLAFIAVATCSVIWHLGMSLEWLWTSCAAQLHSAALHARLI